MVCVIIRCLAQTTRGKYYTWHVHTAQKGISCFSVEVVFDDQCDVLWSLPKYVEPIPLFQTTSFNIDGDSLDLIGGVQGRTFHFQVRYQAV